MGKRTVDFGDLATAAPMAARLPSLDGTPPRARRVPVGSVAANPLNPPGRVLNLDSLESMKDGQIQPCVVVTHKAFVALYPEHTGAVDGTEFVVLAGTRRRAAAEKFGLATLDVVVRDDLATSRVEFDLNAARENFDRDEFSPLDEAEVVDRLVRECGSAGDVARRLNRSETWVSQRRKLLDLIPELKQALVSGELKVRVARELAKLPAPEQRAEWERLFRGKDAGQIPAEPRPKQFRFVINAAPAVQAKTLREHLNDDQARDLAEALLATTKDHA